MATPGLPPEIIAAASDAASRAASLADFFRILLTPPDPPPRAVKAFDHPKEAAQQTFSGMFWALYDMGVPQPLAYLGALIAALIVAMGGVLGNVLFWLLKNVGAAFAEDVLELVDDARKELDPTVANISVNVLNELLGTDYEDQHLATGEDVAAHRARAGEIGSLFHNTLMSEFQSEGDVTPEAGRAAAQRMSGFLINFGVATALISVVGDLVSFGKFETFRELGVEVARNLGLGRLNREAMRPLVHTLIATPYQWWLNQQFHPTQFRLADLVNPFAQELMDHETVFKALDLEGYSEDKIEKLIKLHSKKMPLEDIELYDRWGVSSREASLSLMLELGYPADIATIILQGIDLKRADAAVRSLVDAAEISVVDGHTTADEFSALLDTLPLGFYEKKYRLMVLQYKTKAPHKQITFAQLQKAFEEGLIDDSELRDRLSREGYSAEDVDILEVLTLLALAKAEAAAKAKAAAAAKKAGKTASSTAPATPPAA